MPVIDEAALQLITLSAIKRSGLERGDKIECYNAVTTRFYKDLSVIKTRANHSPLTTKIVKEMFSIDLARIMGL